MAVAAAICIAVGNVSFEDCDMFTWSFGCTGVFGPRTPPAASIATFAMTSFAFMFDWVPEPVAIRTTGNDRQLAVDLALRRPDDPARQLGVQAPALDVRERGSLLQHPHRADDLDRHPVRIRPADREVVDRPLVCAPQ